jgi:hypothetical protein
MSGPKRNPDKLNTIGVVVVGICGAVLVYVSIVALQAFYMNDTSEVQNIADYGGQETAHQSLRATQINTIEDCAANTKPEAGKQQTYRIPIKYAIKMVADDAKTDPSNLVPSQGRSDKPTILPIFGRPKIAPKAADAGAQQGSTATPMTPTGGQGPGGGQPTGQAPNPAGTGTAPGTTTPANPNPTGAQTPSPGTASPNGKAGGNASAKVPGSTPSENKGNTATPKAAGTPKAGSAAPKASGSAAKGSNK